MERQGGEPRRAGWRAGEGAGRGPGRRTESRRLLPFSGRGLKGEKPCCAPHQLGLQRPGPPANTVLCGLVRGAEASGPEPLSLAEVTFPPVARWLGVARRVRLCS